MKKVIMPFGDFDTLILDSGSRLMVHKPEHLLQRLPTSTKQFPPEEDVDAVMMLNIDGSVSTHYTNGTIKD